MRTIGTSVVRGLAAAAWGPRDEGRLSGGRGVGRSEGDGGRPVLLGIAERLEFIDAPSYVADLALYPARGYAMKGNRIAIVTNLPRSAIEVLAPSVRSVNTAGVTAEYYPPRPLPTT